MRGIASPAAPGAEVSDAKAAEASNQPAGTRLIRLPSIRWRGLRLAGVRPWLREHRQQVIDYLLLSAIGFILLFFFYILLFMN